MARPSGAGHFALRVTAIALLLVAVLSTVTGRVDAASGKSWRSATLRLTLSYPANWKLVPERGAALLLRSASGRAEFEIFKLASGPTKSDLRAAADHALVTTKCHTNVMQSSTGIGKLGVSGEMETGLCTGADLGWRLTTVAFRHAGNSLLLRAWLLHADAAGGHDLAAIRASIAGAS
jgi:hypothetical protein